MNQTDLQPPYHVLRYLLRRGELVPFLGAGASLREEQAEEAGPYASLPTGRELAYHLAEYAGLLGEEVVDIYDLFEVASCFELMAGRLSLEEKLTEVFCQSQKPGPLHHFLAHLPAAPLIVTTNYDTLIERAFRDSDREFHLIMTPIERSDNRPRVLWWAPGSSEPSVHENNELLLTPEDLPVIYKIHGGFDPAGKWHRCIITEDDYFEIGGRVYESSLLPLQVRRQLDRSSLLFLGYSLRDVHVRHLVRRFGRRAQKRYLVSKSVSRLDRWRFERLGIGVYELTIAAFLEDLQSNDNA